MSVVENGPELTFVILGDEPRKDGPGPAIGTVVRGTLWLSFRNSSEVFANVTVKPGQGRARLSRGGLAALDSARGHRSCVDHRTDTHNLERAALDLSVGEGHTSSKG